jgi:translocator protein
MRAVTSISASSMLVLVVLAGLTGVSPILAFSSFKPRPESLVSRSNDKASLHLQVSSNKPSSGSSPFTRATVQLHSTASKNSVRSSSSSSGNKAQRLGDSNKNIDPPQLDVDAITKYVIAAAVQMSAFYLLLNAMDWSVARLGLNVDSVPVWANCAFFYACSLKSRVLNPLSNERPKLASLDNKNNNNNMETIRPSWTPPGVTFPIMWLLIVGPLRAYSASLVVAASGGDYANLAIFSFLLHLTIGDIWNTVNNVEKRYGPAALGVGLVWGSAANAAYQYYQVDAMAGQLLGLTLVWLTIAAALVGTIWQLNPDPTTGQVEALYPVKGNVQTEFAWLNKGD